MKWAEELGYVNGVKPLGLQELRVIDAPFGYLLTYGKWSVQIKSASHLQVRLDRLRMAEVVLLRDRL